jgi:signal transduction histidine kinase
MRERTALIGGTLAIDTRPGDGTRVTLEAPLAGPHAPRAAIDRAAASQSA